MEPSKTIIEISGSDSDSNYKTPDCKKEDSSDSNYKTPDIKKDELSKSAGSETGSVTQGFNDKKIIFSSEHIQIPVDDLRNKTFCDYNSIPRSEISRNEVDFLRRVMKKASEERDEKIQKTRKYIHYHDILGTFARVLSTLSGSAGLGSTLSLDPSDAAFPILLTLSLVTLGSSLASTIQDHMNYASKAEINKSTAASYNGVIMEIAQFLSTPGTDRKDVEIFTNSITLKMNTISTQEDV